MGPIALPLSASCELCVVSLAAHLPEELDAAAEGLNPGQLQMEVH